MVRPQQRKQVLSRETASFLQADSLPSELQGKPDSPLNFQKLTVFTNKHRHAEENHV